MAATYTAFLHAPSTSHLAPDASLHYVTTTTTISEPVAILKHLQAQQKQITTLDQKPLSAIESPTALFLETETTFRFATGGGAYLPGMDDNLLDEKLVTFPLLHAVTFNGNGKIAQIRLYWDQGTLLKQVEAIGRTGKNWPIRDGRAQLETVHKSVKASGGDGSAGKIPLGTRDANEVALPQQQQHQKRTSVSATRDPHASLDLFARRDPNEDPRQQYDGPRMVPRASAKPAPRPYDQLFGDEPPVETPRAGSQIRSPSPSKADGVILKAGAGKHYSSNRLFDEEAGDATGTGAAAAAKSPERKKTYGQKYEHFDFGDGHEEEESMAPQGSNVRPMSDGKKGGPTFSFEDFATPPKFVPKLRKDDERHWGQGVEEDDPPSPPKRPIVHAARKDADTHFTLTDEPTPDAQKAKSYLRQQSQKHLYRDAVATNNTSDDSDEASANARKPSARNTTNTNASRRSDDFGAHYSMAGLVPPKPSSRGDNKAENVKPTTTARGDMNAHWSFDPPTPKEKKIYKTAGDGMGSRMNADGRRQWGIGDESDPEVENGHADGVRNSARSSGGGRQRAPAQAGAGAGLQERFGF